jgi:hypothetical protein
MIIVPHPAMLLIFAALFSLYIQHLLESTEKARALKQIDQFSNSEAYFQSAQERCSRNRRCPPAQQKGYLNRNVLGGILVLIVFCHTSKDGNNNYCYPSDH